MFIENHFVLTKQKHISPKEVRLQCVKLTLVYFHQLFDAIDVTSFTNSTECVANEYVNNESVEKEVEFSRLVILEIICLASNAT